eukprot:g2035.t1
MSWDFNVGYVPKGVGRSLQVATELGLDGIGVNFDVEDFHEMQELLALLQHQHATSGGSSSSAAGAASSGGKLLFATGGSSSSSLRNNDRPREIFRNKFLAFVRECDALKARVVKRVTLFHDGMASRGELVEKVCALLKDKAFSSSGKNAAVVSPKAEDAGTAEPARKKPKKAPESDVRMGEQAPQRGKNAPAAAPNPTLHDFCDFLVAIRPTTDNALQQLSAKQKFASGGFKILSVPLEERLGLKILRPYVTSLLAKGVVFEVPFCYALRAESEQVRSLFFNVQKVTRLTHMKHCLIVSGARDVLEMRGAWDLLNYAKVLGLKDAERTMQKMVMHSGSAGAGDGFSPVAERDVVMC